MVGYPFYDRLAIGSYDVDIHPDLNCDYPSYMKDLGQYGVLPYFIPFRAMTNKDIDSIFLFHCKKLYFDYLYICWLQERLSQ